MTRAVALQVAQILQVHLPVRVDREVAPIVLADEHLPDLHAFDLPARAENDLSRRQLTRRYPVLDLGAGAPHQGRRIPPPASSIYYRAVTRAVTPTVDHEASVEDDR